MAGRSPEEPLRLPTDMLDEWERGQLDRDVEVVETSFREALGERHTPLAVATGVIDEQGGVAVADFGCGTAHGLRTLRGELLQARRGSAIRAVGINDADYSNESASRRTRTLVRDRTIEYVVCPGDATPFADGVFDVTYAFELLLHPPHPERILNEMARTTAPGGHLFFNINLLHVVSRRTRFNAALGELARSGYEVHEEVIAARSLRGEDQVRAFAHLVKPAS